LKRLVLAQEAPFCNVKGEITMKPLFSSFAAILLVLVLGSAGCASRSSQPPTPESISDIVQKMVERMNAGDLEGSLAYFADDAMGYIIGLPPTGMEVYAGKEQIRTLWKDSIDNHFQWEVEIASVGNNIVSVKAKTWHDFTRQLGVAPLEYNDVYEIKDGKIVTYATTITEESLAKLKPALAEVMSPEPPTVPLTDSPVSEMTVTFAGGTCTIDKPIALQAGELKITQNVKDQDNEDYALSFFTLDEDKDFPDLMASTILSTPPSWSDMFFLRDLSPGQSATFTVNIKQGPVYMICWSGPPDLPIGNAGPIEVVSEEAITTLESDSLDVSLDDLLGTWITFCPPAGEECTWEFREDGTYGGELVRIPGFVFSGKFAFKNGLLTFETDSGLCSDSPQATYEVHVVKQDGITEEIQFKVVGKDLCKDRRLSFAKVRPYEQ
jgi:hypothetical protein